MGDFRLALRTLRRTPAYTLTVVLTLALGIGGATAVYSILRSVILRPLPYPAADRVMMVAERDSADNIRPASYPTFRDWRNGTDAFEAMAFTRGRGAALKAGDGAERLVAAFVTDEFFRVLPEPAERSSRPTPTPARPPPWCSRGACGSAASGATARSWAGASHSATEPTPWSA